MAAPARSGIDFRAELQPIDGFGFSMAFQRADLLHGARGLSPAKQREVLDLLLSEDKGAGLSILRLGIGSSTDRVYDHMPTILPADPGGPDATPEYVWDGWDGGQVWLAKEAKAYGVTRFFADAWSAPAFMKTNGSENDGGELLPEWRQAYANYLVQYAEFYRQEGIRITDLGFTNEPDWTATYASMRFTPQQAVDFLKVLGPTVRASGLRTGVVCCDAAGWDRQVAYTEAIEADPAAAGPYGPSPATATAVRPTSRSRPTSACGCRNGRRTAPPGTRTGTTAAATTVSPSRPTSSTP
ncbi:glycoside hydrolase [Streptomyces sp. NPDC056664]|uniref:glycoside hydrolase n=1 Tax=unclassified Streptomyces TaxID=2593676 RepID=UPI00368542E6|nr:hypothetical protein [Streptomyces sp. CB02980]